MDIKVTSIQCVQCIDELHPYSTWSIRCNHFFLTDPFRDLPSQPAASYLVSSHQDSHHIITISIKCYAIGIAYQDEIIAF